MCPKSRQVLKGRGNIDKCGVCNGSINLNNSVYSNCNLFIVYN